MGGCVRTHHQNGNSEWMCGSCGSGNGGSCFVKEETLRRERDRDRDRRARQRTLDNSTSVCMRVGGSSQQRHNDKSNNESVFPFVPW